jgi:hypothetical protein
LLLSKRRHGQPVLSLVIGSIGEAQASPARSPSADWTDGDGDQRRYNSIVARASEVNSRIAGHVVA